MAASKKKNINDIILGHSWEPSEATPDFSQFTDEETDTRIRQGNEILKRYFESTFKPSEKIVKANKAWFEALSAIESIYVFGHSLSEVDSHYFFEICSHIDKKKVTWQITYHTDADLVSHKAFVERLGISPMLVEYKILSDYAAC